MIGGGAGSAGARPGVIGWPSPDDPVLAALLARSRFPDRPEVDLAVSGGPDSSALLALAVAAGKRATVHHVDHSLRPGSEHDIATVRAVAAAWRVPVVAHQVQVGAGGNLEERCRHARLEVLPEDVLFGHTADDLAETVVLRLLRGTGPSGLAAMGVSSHPLLGLRRTETVELCAHLGLVPLDDPMNHDARFTRNRVRSEVLPLMADVAGRDVVPLLCRLAELAGEQADLLGDLVAVLDASDSSAVASAPAALAREALRGWWCAGTGLPAPDAAAVERMLQVARLESRSCDVVAGWRLHRSKGRLRLVPPA